MGSAVLPALGALIVIVVLPLPIAAYAALLSVLVTALSVVHGRPWRLFLVPAAAVALLLRVGLHSWPIALCWSLIPLAAVIGGICASAQLRYLQRSAELAATRARRLTEAVVKLREVDSRDAIYQELPQLLSHLLTFTHADVWVPSEDGRPEMVAAAASWPVPAGTRVPLQSVVGRAMRQAGVQSVPVTATDPDYVEVAGLGPMGCEIALPISAHRAVVAVLNVERIEKLPFAEREINELQGLVQAVGAAVERADRLDRTREMTQMQSFILDFSRQLGEAAEPATVTERGLSLLLARTGADFGTLWVPDGSSLRQLAAKARDDLRLPHQRSPLTVLRGESTASGPLFVPDAVLSPYCTSELLEAGLQSFAVIPMAEADGRLRAVLELLFFRKACAFADAERQLLTRAAERLNGALEQSWTTSRLGALVEALHALARISDVTALYDAALEAVVHLIPGTDASSLMLVESDTLRLHRGIGYRRTDAPAHWRLRNLDDAVRWYGGDHVNFLRGTPRVLQGQDLHARGAAFGAPGVRCNLCLPLMLRGSLLGMLNLDSLSRSDAFSRESVSLAEMYAIQLTELSQQARLRQSLAVAASTDALTGLANRRAFDERLHAEWQASERYHHPLSLLILDLRSFKAINDVHGHPVGDRALVSVANAMTAVRREGDAVFRWGGDEFAILLRHADRDGALSAARRYLQSIHDARFDADDGTLLQVNARMGIATRAIDAQSMDDLLKIADDRLREAKRSGRAIAS